jgi:hypothetical protein
VNITQAIDKVSRLRANFRTHLQDAMRQTQDIAIGMNQDQMYAGIRSDGSEISPFYTYYTIQEKKRKGQPYDRVTLRNLGNFYDGMYMQFESIGWSILSTDEKAARLEAKYGNKIFGLIESNQITWAVEYIRPVLVRDVARIYGFALTK